MSWRAKLAKSNINILQLTLLNTPDGVVYRWGFEFTYHPKPGTFKWCKTFVDVNESDSEKAGEAILNMALDLRKELEA